MRQPSLKGAIDLMKYIKSQSKDVFYNLAMEEYIFEHYREDDILLLWKNDNSIVLGKYQNIYQEINIKEVEKSNIKVARRITGGGTVFHDKGNLNYSVITKHDEKQFAEYDKFLKPVIKVLNGMGVPAAKRKKSDIAVGDLKISGSAQTIKGDRILHHGTLLFDADISALYQMLKPTDGKIHSSAVPSVRSQVTNIKKYIGDPNMTMEKLEEQLIKGFSGGDNQELILSEEEIDKIKNLKADKYQTWPWNYGNSPTFSFYKKSMIDKQEVKVALRVKGGCIEDCRLICGDGKVAKAQEMYLTQRLKNIRYRYKTVRTAVNEIIPSYKAEAFTDCFF